MRRNGFAAKISVMASPQLTGGIANGFGEESRWLSYNENSGSGVMAAAASM
jgi:hypothetical protein